MTGSNALDKPQPEPPAAAALCGFLSGGDHSRHEVVPILNRAKEPRAKTILKWFFA
jgi:hypothetical protein